MMSSELRQAVILAVARLLREERARQKLTLVEVGDRAGLHHVAVLRIENAERTPGLDTLLRLSDALGIELADLISRAVRLAPGATDSSPEGKPSKDKRRRRQ